MLRRAMREEKLVLFESVKDFLYWEIVIPSHLSVVTSVVEKSWVAVDSGM
jgi:hypothetical protein